jgi:hypothetical protein
MARISLAHVVWVCVAIFLAVRLVAPGFTSTKVRARTSCLVNLRLIDKAKIAFASDNDLPSGTAVTKEQLLPYLKDGWPICSDGGVYTLGALGEDPRCSYPEHRGYKVIPRR